tara:strand:+ start:2816 stop:3109 length:294 start_codon:yes stop_codon:yes gene_type:complete
MAILIEPGDIVDEICRPLAGVSGKRAPCRDERTGRGAGLAGRLHDGWGLGGIGAAALLPVGLVMAGKPEPGAHKDHSPDNEPGEDGNDEDRLSLIEQ